MSYNETAALLGAIFGAFLALAFQLIPGLANRFETYTKETKAQIMFGVLVVSAVFIALISCTFTSFSFGIACTQQGFEQIAIAFAIALTTGVMSNQPTHSLAKHALPTVGKIQVDVPAFAEGPKV